jgi:hypothetical protein
MVNDGFLSRARNAALVPVPRNAGHRACNAKYFVLSRWSKPVPPASTTMPSKSYQPEIAQAITHELAAIRSALGRNARQLAVLINDGKDRRMTRAAGDLGARLDGESGNAGQRDIDVMFA